LKKETLKFALNFASESQEDEIRVKHSTTSVKLELMYVPPGKLSTSVCCPDAKLDRYPLCDQDQNDEC